MLFVVSMIGSGFKVVIGDYVKELFLFVFNFIMGLIIGMVVMVLIQLLSIVILIIVGMVVGGLFIIIVILMMMGVNIGISIINILVSLGYVVCKDEFQCVFNVVIIYDFFNVMLVFIFLLLEMVFGVFEYLLGVIVVLFDMGSILGMDGFNFIKVII